MVEKYMFLYENENEFKKLESALKKYNMLAYKKLYFEYYPSLKSGELLGKEVSSNGDIHEYEVIVDENKKTITLSDLTPREILSEGHQSELVTYKGVMVSKEHADKDMFKINLLNMINKEN